MREKSIKERIKDIIFKPLIGYEKYDRRIHRIKGCITLNSTQILTRDETFKFSNDKDDLDLKLKEIL